MSRKNVKRFKSVSEMRRTLNDDPKDVRQFDERLKRRQLVKTLFAMRSVKGVSQKEIADRLDCTQSRVSKIESGEDADLRLRELEAYAKSLGCDLTLVFTDRGNRSVDMIKFFALSIKRELAKLVKLADGDKALAEGVAAFHGEAFFNLLRIIQDSSTKLRTPDEEYIHVAEIDEVDKELRARNLSLEVDDSETESPSNQEIASDA